MSVDRDYTVRISMVADSSAAKEAVADIDKLNSSTRNGAEASAKAGEATEKHSKHLAGLHKLCHALNDVIPGLGIAMQAAFSPIAAMVMVAVAALRFFHEKLKEVGEEMKRMEEEAAKPLSHRMDAQRESTIALASGMAGLQARLAEAARSEVTLKERMEQAIAMAKQQNTEAAALAEAMNANELSRLDVLHAAGLKSEEEYNRRRLEIEVEYRRKKRRAEEIAEAEELMMRRRAAGEAEAQQPELTGKAQQAEARRARAEEDLAALTPRAEIDERHQKSRQALKDWEGSETWKDVGTGTSQKALAAVFAQFYDAQTHQITGSPAQVREAVWSTQGINRSQADLIDKKFDEWSKLKGADSLAEKEWKDAPAAEARRKVAAESAARDADRAAKKAEENQQFITDTNKDVESRSRLLDERHKANQAQNTADGGEFVKTPEGKQIQQAMEAADLWAKSGKISGPDKDHLTELYRELSGGDPNRGVSDQTLRSTFMGASDAGRFHDLYGRARAAGDVQGAESANGIYEHTGNVSQSGQNLMLKVGAVLVGHDVTLKEASSALDRLERSQRGLKDILARLGKIEAQLPDMLNH